MDDIHRSAGERSIILLREDALARGMQELAIVYGWSLLRLKGEQIIASAQFKLLSKPNG